MMICTHCGVEVVRSSRTSDDKHWPEWAHQGRPGYTNYTNCIPDFGALVRGELDASDLTFAEPWQEHPQQRLI